jgi:uncharacterized protein (TIGR02284 family)
MTTTNETNFILNALIAATLDSAEGYEAAAHAAKNPEWNGLFAQRGRQRRNLAEALQAEVRAHGGDPAQHGTMMGTAHRLLLKFRNFVAGDDRSVIAAVEADESQIAAKFADAIGFDTLTASAVVAVAKANDAIRADHAEMLGLQHALQAPAAH